METASGELWAVYLPRVAMNVAVYVNGELVGDGGAFAPHLARKPRRVRPGSRGWSSSDADGWRRSAADRTSTGPPAASTVYAARALAPRRGCEASCRRDTTQNGLTGKGTPK
jgi:hypothetical protein